ncbi:AMP-binding protein [Amycolatopsis sp. NPDC059090]|uniref:AMP-binding protein n=1 Tax=unclassified Amycolatopsis TaxID=2618356 RepID=UPI00366A6991
MQTQPGQSATMLEATLANFEFRGEQTALTHESSVWTYRELCDQVYRMARALAKLGVTRGDIVALLTGNRVETLVLRYAVNVIGGCVVTLYDGQSASLLAATVRQTGADYLIFDAARYDSLTSALPTKLRNLTMIAVGEHSSAPDLADLAENEPTDRIIPDIRPGDLTSLRLTGGSTGFPKCVPRYAGTPQTSSVPPLPWQAAVQLLCTPMAHLGGTLAELVLSSGGRVVVHSEFNSARVLEKIESERITHLWLPPQFLYRLLDDPASPGTDTSSLRWLSYGGATAHRAGSPRPWNVSDRSLFRVTALSRQRRSAGCHARITCFPNF